MNNQVKLIDGNWLLECLKKEAEFCIKEKFNEKNTRFYLGRETVLTDIIRQIESGKYEYVSDTPPVPTIKPGDKVNYSDFQFPNLNGAIVDHLRVERFGTYAALAHDGRTYIVPLNKVEVVE
ncbi:hypothetical protein [Paenibacillus dakarensis]|uniref:hypothetical protein n=1 Tax=Paenibacillus dakarensis TaxID=1527293 RepID=UPI0006D53A9E|nr:hypothetical protein [Paenibacillus dakarensis]